jgi:hypothetical protein
MILTDSRIESRFNSGIPSSSVPVEASCVFQWLPQRPREAISIFPTFQLAFEMDWTKPLHRSLPYGH